VCFEELVASIAFEPSIPNELVFEFEAPKI